MTTRDDGEPTLAMREELRALREEVNALRAVLARRSPRPIGRFHRPLVWGVAAVAASLVAGIAVAAPGSPFACPGGDLYCFSAGAPAQADEVNSNFSRLQSWLIEKVGDLGTQQLHVQGPIVSGSVDVATQDLGFYSQSNGRWIRVVANAAPIKFFTDGGTGVGTTAALTVEANSASVTAPVLNSSTLGATTANAGTLNVSGTANITTLNASNLYYTGEYLADAGASESGYGEAYMTSTANSFCFLIGVRAGDDDNEDDVHHCEIQVSGSTWWLRMWSNSDESGGQWCKARCFRFR